MALELLIGGTDYTTRLVVPSVVITETLQVRGFSMDCNIIIENQEATAPLSGQSIIFSVDGTREFAGRIAEVDQLQPGLPGQLIYRLSCIDWTIDFDAKLINFVFPQQIVGDTIRHIVGIVGRGFTSNSVIDAVVAEQLEVEYETPSAVVQRMADSIEHQWYIDYDRDMHFFALLGRAAPIANIDVDVDTGTYDELTWSESWDQVKNRIYLTGIKLKSTNSEVQTITGDAVQKFFPLNYEPSHELGDMIVTVDGVAQNLFTDMQDGQAGDGETAATKAYVCFDNWGVRFPDNNAPGDGLDVVLTYTYLVEPVVIVEDPVSIATMAAIENDSNAPSDGVHELRFEVPDLLATNETAILNYGNLLLLRYAEILYVADFHSTVQGWGAGMSLTISSSKRGISDTIFITQVTKTIRNVANTPGDPFTFDYQIHCESSPYPG